MSELILNIFILIVFLYRISIGLLYLLLDKFINLINVFTLYLPTYIIRQNEKHRQAILVVEF